jgi:Na+-driven multidrug efflux pump
VAVATHQLAFTIWTFLAFILDAVAIAAQAITGRYLGAGDVPATREVTRRMIQWGLVGGAVLGIATIAVAPIVGRLFTEDPEVRALLVPVLVVVGLSQPLCGLVFVLDGILIGAGDGRFLMWSMVIAFVACASVSLSALAFDWGIVGVWAALVVLICVRLVLMGWRFAGRRWLVTGWAA